MLTNLSVRNLAVVEDIALTFKAGMTSLTGETGAGKSMLVDALSLVLGDRADSTMIRHGCERAEIEAGFDLNQNAPLMEWLKQQELDDDLCQLRRTINRDGRSKAYINGRAVPLSQLREVSERAIDIHGQHAHQSLLRPDTQRELLDIVADNKPLLNQLKKAFKHWQSLQQELQQLQQQAQQQSARHELLQYQVNELGALSLNEQSVSQLLQQQQQLANASQLAATAKSALHHIFDVDQGAAYDVISHALSDLEKMQEIEPRFAEAVETLNAAIINLDESGSVLRHYLDQDQPDPSQLELLEKDLAQLHDLARKHRIEIEQLPAYYSQLTDELTAFSESEHNQDKLQQSLTKQTQICQDLAQQISARRQAAAPPLSKQITASIQQLAIPAGRVEISVSPLPQSPFNETGYDQIQFKVSTNPGQPTGDLAKVASGGELARISLAIQVVTAGKHSVPTLIFDEVDVGIGGSVAEIVGQHLRNFASTQQVICITHLAQVAAQAHHQLQVNKIHSADSTKIAIKQLGREQRVEEIARMLGGVNLTQKTRLHAEEMLDQAQQ